MLGKHICIQYSGSVYENWNVGWWKIVLKYKMYMTKMDEVCVRNVK